MKHLVIVVAERHVVKGDAALLGGIGLAGHLRLAQERHNPAARRRTALQFGPAREDHGKRLESSRADEEEEGEPRGVEGAAGQQVDAGEGHACQTAA